MASDKKKSRVNVWLVIGVGILVVLLIIWLTIADLNGDTDVAACVVPQLSNSIMQLLP